MSYKYEFYIDAEPVKVWDALTGPEGTRAVFFGCLLESGLQSGDSFAYVGPGNDGANTVHVYGDIVTCEPGRYLEMIEHPGPSYYKNHHELTSRMVYKLEQVGSCTKLTLLNDQFSDNHLAYEKTESSWWMMLSNLKTWIETGKTLDLGW